MTKELMCVLQKKKILIYHTSQELIINSMFLDFCHDRLSSHFKMRKLSISKTVFVLCFVL